MIRKPDALGVARAAELIRAGELVAFPTETVYGLGARADSSQAVRRIYEAKGRPPANPSIVHAGDAAQSFALAREVTDVARALARAFWPGPITLVLPLRPGAVAPEVTAGGPTVALRVPAHPVARALLLACGLPIAAPSANRSSQVSPTRAEHVERSLGPGVMVLDGGPTGFGIESTIVDCTCDPVVVLRRGSIGLAALARIAPVVDRADAITAPGETARAPGSLERHYAPGVPLRIAERGQLGAVIAELARTVSAGSGRAGVLTRGACDVGRGEEAEVEVLMTEPEGYARELYAALHRLEVSGVDFIVVERVPAGPEWSAVADRLARASR